MDKTSYVLCGSSGNYSDWHMWVVCTYSSKEAAEQSRDSLNTKLLEYKELHVHGNADIYRTTFDPPLEIEPNNNRDIGSAYELRDAHPYEIREVPYIG